MKFKKNISETHTELVKIRNYLAFDLILGNDFKAQNISTPACYVTLSIGMDK